MSPLLIFTLLLLGCSPDPNANASEPAPSHAQLQREFVERHEEPVIYDTEVALARSLPAASPEDAAAAMSVLAAHAENLPYDAITAVRQCLIAVSCRHKVGEPGELGFVGDPRLGGWVLDVYIDSHERWAFAGVPLRVGKGRAVATVGGLGLLTREDPTGDNLSYFISVGPGNVVQAGPYEPSILPHTSPDRQLIFDQGAQKLSWTVCGHPADPRKKVNLNAQHCTLEGIGGGDWGIEADSIEGEGCGLVVATLGLPGDYNVRCDPVHGPLLSLMNARPSIPLNTP